MKYFKKLLVIFFFRYKPKEILYRALQDNPSAKAFGLDLIHYSAEGHSNTKLKDSGSLSKVIYEIQDIFEQKGVRIRIPIEELKVLLETEDQ